MMLVVSRSYNARRQALSGFTAFALALVLSACGAPDNGTGSVSPTGSSAQPPTVVATSAVTETPTESEELPISPGTGAPDALIGKYCVLFEKAADALITLDYKVLFELQHSQEYEEFLAELRDTGNSAYWFEFEGAGCVFSTQVTHDVNIEDITKIYIAPDNTFEELRTWEGYSEWSIDISVSAVRYYEKNYMFIVKSDGNYTIYKQLNESPETHEILRLKTKSDAYVGDIFTGDAIRETYENGEIVKTETTTEYGGIEIPSGRLQTSFISTDSKFWELS
jgi:hypothetical protein